MIFKPNIKACLTKPQKDPKNVLTSNAMGEKFDRIQRESPHPQGADTLKLYSTE